MNEMLIHRGPAAGHSCWPSEDPAEQLVVPSHWHGGDKVNSFMKAGKSDPGTSQGHHAAQYGGVSYLTGHKSCLSA